MKKIFMIVFAGAFLISLAAIDSQDRKWDVPEKYLSMKNTADASDSECIDVGKSLYVKHCKSCHGSEGYGDGSKADELDTAMPDITTAEYKKQAPGIKYYQSYIGRDDMPNFEKKIPNEEDRWCLINYIESL